MDRNIRAPHYPEFLGQSFSSRIPGVDAALSPHWLHRHMSLLSADAATLWGC